MQSNQTTHLLLITNAGETLNKEQVLLLIKNISQDAHVELAGVLAVTRPSLERACYIKAYLQHLGMVVPVGAGVDLGPPGRGCMMDDKTEFASKADVTARGEDFLLSQLCEAGNDSLTWLVLSDPSDMIGCIKRYEGLFVQKTKRVVLVGNCQYQANQANKGGPAFIKPDACVVKDAAHFYLYRRLQELAIPITVVTKRVTQVCFWAEHHVELMACLAAIPTLKKRFFIPSVKNVLQFGHEIIGESHDEHGVINPSEISRYLSDYLQR